MTTAAHACVDGYHERMQAHRDAWRHGTVALTITGEIGDIAQVAAETLGLVDRAEVRGPVAFSTEEIDA